MLRRKWPKINVLTTKLGRPVAVPLFTVMLCIRRCCHSLNGWPRIPVSRSVCLSVCSSVCLSVYLFSCLSLKTAAHAFVQDLLKQYQVASLERKRKQQFSNRLCFCSSKKRLLTDEQTNGLADGPTDWRTNQWMDIPSYWIIAHDWKGKEKS